MMKIIGLWNPDKLKESYLKRLFRHVQSAFILSMICCYNLSEYVFLFSLTNNIDRFVGDIALIATNLGTCMKGFNLYFRRQKIEKLVETLQREDLKYDSEVDFEPEKIIEKYNKINYYFILFYCIFVAGFIAMYDYLPEYIKMFFFKEYLYTKNDNGDQVFCRYLVFDNWMPFEHNTVATCFLGNTIQVGFICLLLAVLFCSDTIFMAIVNNTTCHVCVLAEAFRTIPTRCYHRKILNPSIDLEEEMSKEMKKCIKHLIVLKEVCVEIEDIFKHVILMQLFDVLLITCDCLLIITSVFNK